MKKYSHGFVYKNGNYWRACLSYTEDGKSEKLRRSTGVKCFPGKDKRNKGIAEQFLADWRDELVSLEEELNPNLDQMSFYDYCDHYLKTHTHVKATTMDGYNATMRRIKGSMLGDGRGTRASPRRDLRTRSRRGYGTAGVRDDARR